MAEEIRTSFFYSSRTPNRSLDKAGKKTVQETEVPLDEMKRHPGDLPSRECNRYTKPRVCRIIPPTLT
jgi:hypothetical protein